MRTSWPTSSIALLMSKRAVADLDRRRQPGLVDERHARLRARVGGDERDEHRRRAAGSRRARRQEQRRAAEDAQVLAEQRARRRPHARRAAPRAARARARRARSRLVASLRREDERAAALAVLERSRPEALALRRVERRGRLVEQQQRRGAPRSASARFSRWRWPTESAPLVRPSSRRPKRGDAAVGAAPGSCSPSSRAKSSRFSRGVRPPVVARPLRGPADCAARRRSSTRPPLGGSAPASSESSVDFPAPFGPISATRLAGADLDVGRLEGDVPRRSGAPTPRAASSGPALNAALPRAGPRADRLRARRGLRGRLAPAPARAAAGARRHRPRAPRRPRRHGSSSSAAGEELPHRAHRGRERQRHERCRAARRSRRPPSSADDDEQRVQPQRVPHHLRHDDVALDLVDDEEEERDPDRRDRVTASA